MYTTIENNKKVKMIEKIEIDGILYSIILRADFHQEEGIEFFTPKEFSQQLASMKRPAGYRIKPHLHNQNIREVVFTKETLVIKSGKVRIDFYNDEETYIESRELKTGDIILLAHGGHGFVMLEESEMIEIKQGPYVNQESDKTLFHCIDDANVKIVLQEKKLHHGTDK
jgi:hypothetical protein